MARKKTTNPETVQDPVENPDVTEVKETTIETEEKPAEKEAENPETVQDPVENPDVTEEVKPITETTIAEEAIPEHAKGVLKAFNNHKELYVSRTGAAFPADTKPSLRGNAILYKNPYYKS